MIVGNSMNDTPTIYPDMMDAEYCYGALISGPITNAERHATARHLRTLMDKLEMIDNQEPWAYMTYKGYLLHSDDPKLSEYCDPVPLYDLSLYKQNK